MGCRPCEKARETKSKHWGTSLLKQCTRDIATLAVKKGDAEWKESAQMLIKYIPIYLKHRFK